MTIVKDICNDSIKLTYDNALRECKKNRESLLGLISKARANWLGDYGVNPTHLLLNHDAMYILEEDSNAELENGSNILGLTIIETVDESVKLAYIP